MLYSRLKPLLFRLDAETAHDELAGLMAALSHLPRSGELVSALTGAKARPAPKTVFGMSFPNPVGLAAGFDKDGRLFPALAGLGFGFMELGSVTLEPQPGNPRPRLFRLPAERAIVNRMGFNSEGARAVARRLAQSEPAGVPLGINLGLNKGVAAKDAPAAYARTFALLAGHGDYFVVNVSSPNTPGLRELQQAKDLKAILDAVQGANAAHKPVLVKLSPDLSDDGLEACVEVSEDLAQGLVVSNTTLSREGVPDRWKDEAGGLSGAPLKARALALTRRVRGLTTLPVIGAGGLSSGSDVRERMAAGADLVQLYTALVHEGPGVVKRILWSLQELS